MLQTDKLVDRLVDQPKQYALEQGSQKCHSGCSLKTKLCNGLVTEVFSILKWGFQVCQ